MIALIVACLILALVPAVLFGTNLAAYRRLPEAAHDAEPEPISVLIPARNEEEVLGPALESVLASYGCPFEVIVLDDRSEDRTAEVASRIAAGDDRVRVVEGEEPPPDWCGKQHACWRLAQEARCELFLFLDADVRLAPDALVRISRFMSESGVDLASGVPRQVTVGLMERMLIPLIHFILLGFLPISSMRRTSLPSLSAGCGQLFVARRSSYFRAGGHAAIRASRHDGIKLPRVFRSRGFRNDLFDPTDLASCRMYRSPGEVWRGLAKNADEALAAPGLIAPMSTMLLGGQVLPFLFVLAAASSWPRPWTGPELAASAVALGLAWSSRWAAVVRFRQSAVGALLHPIGVALLVAVQWWAFVGNLLGRPRRWKGRTYPAGGGLRAERPGRGSAVVEEDLIEDEGEAAAEDPRLDLPA